MSFEAIAGRGFGGVSDGHEGPGEVHGPGARLCGSRAVVRLLGRGLLRRSTRDGGRRRRKEVFAILTRTVAAEVALFAGEGSLNTRRCKASESRPQFTHSRMFPRRR